MTVKSQHTHICVNYFAKCSCIIQCVSGLTECSWALLIFSNCAAACIAGDSNITCRSLRMLHFL